MLGKLFNIKLILIFHFDRIRDFVDFLPLSNKDESPKRENDDPWYVFL